MITLWFILSFPLYYALKGIILHNEKGGQITLILLTSIIAIVSLWLGTYYETTWLRYALLLYYGVSFIEYIIRLQNNKFLLIPWGFSGISLSEKSINLRYLIFKPLVTILANCILVWFCKRFPLSFNDQIDIEISSSDHTHILIKI